MKRIILLLSLILIFTVSCKPDDSDKPSGIYFEKSPIALRTTMDFTSATRVTVTYIDGKSKEFSYSVGEMIMTLTPVNSATYPAQNVFYHLTDPSKFEIGNIYDVNDQVMVFEKPIIK